jgi:O-antigen ligase
MRVLAIIRDEPQYLLFGIGYKTLPVTRLFQSEIITDNGYLSLLLETGILGLAGYLFLSFAILRTFLHLSRHRSDAVAFWSMVLFSIWCGELVQMMATDAYTYWRSITMFTALAAVAMNMAERENALAAAA